jgi:hypothetical protein
MRKCPSQCLHCNNSEDDDGEDGSVVESVKARSAWIDLTMDVQYTHSIRDTQMDKSPWSVVRTDRWRCPCIVIPNKYNLAHIALPASLLGACCVLVCRRSWCTEEEERWW